MKSVDLLDLLRQRHAADVFVAECKMGRSSGASPTRRLDAWVLKRSWSPLTIIGYELKASRVG